MTDWKELPKERHYEVFDLLDEGCEVETKGSDYGWHKVKIHRVDGAIVFDNNVGLGMVPTRQFRYREPEPEWLPLGCPSACEIARLLSEGYRVQVSSYGNGWIDVHQNETSGNIVLVSVDVAVRMNPKDMWRYSK